VRETFSWEKRSRGGDEGGRGYAWDRVSLHRGFSVGGSPIESRNVHAFQNIRVFVERDNKFVYSSKEYRTPPSPCESVFASYVSIRQQTYVSIRQQAYVSIRQQNDAVSARRVARTYIHMAYVSIRRHTYIQQYEEETHIDLLYSSIEALLRLN